ncbi:GT-D fold domain-containing protein [Bacillus coreaensis]
MESTKHEFEQRFLRLQDVLQMMKDAIHNKKPFSLARFGHAEIYYSLWPTSTAFQEGLDYCAQYNGATAEPEKIKELVIRALLSTKIVGLLSKEEHEFFHSETIRLLTSLDYEPKYVCSPFITHPMSKDMGFWNILRPLKVVLVGRRSLEAKPLFEKMGVKIVGTKQLEGINQIRSLQNELVNKKDEWDVAILAAGVPATILTNQLAKATNNVVIDFGHALDVMIDGEAFDFDKLVEEYRDNMIE